jgi:hypothetical protein
MESPRFQIGSICKINFALSQMFHRIECESPSELPDARFNFFIEKVFIISLFFFNYFLKIFFV